MICPKISEKACQTEICYWHAKIANSSHPSTEASSNCLIAPQVRPNHIQLRFRTVIVMPSPMPHASHCPGSGAETNGRVIGFVISFPGSNAISASLQATWRRGQLNPCISQSTQWTDILRDKQRRSVPCEPATCHRKQSLNPDAESFAHLCGGPRLK